MAELRQDDSDYRASNGIGPSTARLLAHAGASVVIAGRRDDKNEARFGTLNGAFANAGVGMTGHCTEYPA